MRFALVSQAAPGGGATQDFTSPGFGAAAEILGAIFYFSSATADDAAPVDPMQLSIGACDRGGNEWVQAVAAYGDNLGDPTVAMTGLTNACIAARDPISTNPDQALAAFDSIITDGVRVSWSGATTGIVSCLLIANDGSDDFAVGTGTVDNFTGLTATPGFESDAVAVAAGPPIGSSVANLSLSWGFSTPGVASAAGGFAMTDDADPAATVGWAADDVVAGFLDGVGGLIQTVTLDSVTATEIIFGTPGVSDLEIAWAAFLCPDNQVWAGLPVFDGSDLTTQPVNAPGFEGGTLLQMVTNATSDGDEDPRASVCPGARSGVASRSVCGESQDAETPPEATAVTDAVAVHQTLPSTGADWRVGDVAFTASGYALTLTNVAGTDQDTFAVPSLLFGVGAVTSGSNRRNVAYRSERSRRLRRRVA